jgi:GT2 family glycosyltransferase
MNDKIVSAVVVTYRRALDLKLCIDMLLQQTLPLLELIVVDNGAEYGDDARRVCETVAGNIPVHYIVSPSNCLPAARNLGVSHCRGDYVALIDDDVRIANDYLATICSVFDQYPEAVGVQGYIDPGQRSPLREFLHRLFGLYHMEENRCRVLPTISTTYPAPLTQVIPCEWISGSNQVYRREVLKEVTWDEKLLKYADGEDLDHSYRVYRHFPGRLFITPDARVIHEEGITGRTVKYELIVMREVYAWYLHNKLFPQSICARFSFLWSRIGRLIFTVGTGFKGRSSERNKEVAFLLDAYRFAWRHRYAISVGNLDAYNSKFNYGDAPI